jgi:hypothetical protein
VLREKSNEKIHTKLSLGYDKDALCQRTMDTWAARFRSGRTAVEDDDRSERPFRGDSSAAISGYLERNSHASCREFAKDLFVPKATISRGLEEIGSRFFIARLVPHELSAESKANRMDICQEILEILEKFDSQQKNHVIIGNEFWIY